MTGKYLASLHSADILFTGVSGFLRCYVLSVCLNQNQQIGTLKAWNCIGNSAHPASIQQKEVNPVFKAGKNNTWDLPSFFKFLNVMLSSILRQNNKRMIRLFPPNKG